MKSGDTSPSVAVVRDATPQPGEEDADTGRRGQLPIAVSEGDFSTPTQRTRTITRPRGLRTLEQTTGAAPVAPPGDGGAFPTSVAGSSGLDPAALAIDELPRREPSVVDEFLAAPPTPVPETDETPAPEGGPSPSDLWGLPASGNAIENLDAAQELRRFALDGTSPTGSGSGADATAIDTDTEEAEIFSAPVEEEEPDNRAVDDLLDPATVDILASEPDDENPEVVHAASFESLDGAVVAGAVVADGAHDLPDGDVHAEITADIHTSDDAVVDADDATLPLPVAQGPAQVAPAAEPELSPLAQTLANMAETMHGDALDVAVDLDIADGPLLPLPVPDPASRTPAPRPTPPPLPTGSVPLPDITPSQIIHASKVSTLAGLPEALAERPRRPKRSKPWYEEVFDESYLRTLPFMTAEQTLQEVDFIESSLGLPRGSEVLDVGCGYGRHAIELVQRGLSVTGLDLSLPLLIRAADESQRRSVSVNFVHADMREISFERQFSGAYSMLTSFGYFDDESNLRVAEGIARALKPGGRFLIDVLNRDYVVGDLPARVWWEGDGCVVLEEVDFNFNTNRVLTHRSVVFEDGQQLEQEISVRVYSLHELGKLLRQAGFRVIEVSGSIPTRGHFFGAHSRNLLILAERRSE
ncbi:MAG: methyltransferase domain-containing protein [Myxococcales bacterium]